jgi:hypothetical protein
MQREAEFKDDVPTRCMSRVPKEMRLIALAVAALSLSSCASFEQPYNINGQYYFVSQKMCHRIQQTSPTEIVCYNAKGKSFPRRALTSYELAQYNAQVQASSNDLAAANAALAAQTQATLATASRYTPPASTPVATTGTSFANCSSYGNQFSCSSPLPEANFSCTKTDTLYICRRR